MAGFGALFFLLLIVAAIVGPVAPPETSSASTKATAAKVVKPAPAEDQKTRDALIAVIRTIAVDTVSCAVHAEKVVNLTGEASGDPDLAKQEKAILAYAEAVEGEPRCREIAEKIGKTDAPTLSDSAMFSNLGLAISECRKASIKRADGLESVKVFFNGDHSSDKAMATAALFVEARTLQKSCLDTLQYVGRESGLEADAMSFLKP
jgi:hypothetical protein